MTKHPKYSTMEGMSIALWSMSPPIPGAAYSYSLSVCVTSRCRFVSVPSVLMRKLMIAWSREDPSLFRSRASSGRSFSQMSVQPLMLSFELFLLQPGWSLMVWKPM